MKKVDLYKSSFPARFGGRLSSIVDVRTNDGNMQLYHGSLTIGLLTSHLQFEGPIWKDHTSFIISARRSYIDCFLPLVMPKDERGGYSLYDINAKLNHRFSEQIAFSSLSIKEKTTSTINTKMKISSSKLTIGETYY